MKAAEGTAGIAVREAQLDAGLSLSQLAGEVRDQQEPAETIECGSNVTVESLERIAVGLGYELQVRFV